LSSPKLRPFSTIAAARRSLRAAVSLESQES
jgi:hypothetical protein